MFKYTDMHTEFSSCNGDYTIGLFTGNRFESFFLYQSMQIYIIFLVIDFKFQVYSHRKIGQEEQRIPRTENNHSTHVHCLPLVHHPATYWYICYRNKH